MVERKTYFYSSDCPLYFKSLSVALLETLLCFSVSSARTLLCRPVGFCHGIGVPVFSLTSLLSERAWPHSRSPASFSRALLSQPAQPCGVLARLACGVQSLKESWLLLASAMALPLVLSTLRQCSRWGSAVAQSQACLMVTVLLECTFAHLLQDLWVLPNSGCRAHSAYFSWSAKLYYYRPLLLKPSLPKKTLQNLGGKMLSLSNKNNNNNNKSEARK